MVPHLNDPHDRHEDQPAENLSEEDKQEVGDRGAGSAKVVHEVIRLQGNEELSRSIRSLLFSGFAAGVAICSSLLTEAFLHMRLPDQPWSELIVPFGYSVGFIIVILGNLQLFTETTVTAVLPLATHPTSRNLIRLLRLWAAVFLANIAGTFFVAALIVWQVIVEPEQLRAALEVSRQSLTHGFAMTLVLAAPAGFLIGSIAWVLPNARGTEFWVIMMITYVVGLGGFSHVVVGSAEAWLLMLNGDRTFSQTFGGFILPALVGNIIGGTGLFAVLAHGQVRDEIKKDT
jgi:formate/nitrite transporter FocA (FNT family)